MEWVKLCDVAEVIMGQSPKSEYCNDNKEGLPFYQGVSDFGEIYPVPSKYCTEPKKIAEIDDILIGVRAPVGDLNISNSKCCIGRGVAAIRANEKFISKKYLFYFLKTQKQYFEINSTGSTFKAINKSVLSETLVPIININKQKIIEDILDRIENIIRKRKEQIQSYDDLIESLFFEMFGNPITNSKHFKTNKFINVVRLKRGYDLPVKSRVGNKYEVYGSNGVLDGHNEFKVEEAGVITGRSGTIGKVFRNEGMYWPLNTTLYSEKTYGNNVIFLEYLLKNFKLERFATGTGVPTLNRNIVHKKKIIEVPIELQNKFADYVIKIEEEKKKLNSSLKELEDLFDALMQNAFSGNLFKD